MIRVLFVCTGNICRSPTAEGVFRHKVREAGLEGRIGWDSAGTHGYHVGEAPDSRALRAARRRGIDLADLRARRIQTRDFHDFDYVLAMDDGHLAQLRRLMPRDSGAELALFLDYCAARRGEAVPDPYYGAAEDFERVLDLVEEGSEALLDHIRRSRFPAPRP
jgi:protein-tyrosine phosphatase